MDIVVSLILLVGFIFNPVKATKEFLTGVCEGLASNK